jgi:hypothetical protein
MPRVQFTEHAVAVLDRQDFSPPACVSVHELAIVLTEIDTCIPVAYAAEFSIHLCDGDVIEPLVGMYIG